MTREEAIDGLKVVRTIHNGNYAPQIDEAIKLLEQTRWIPVSERLPYIDTAVIVDDGVDIFVAWYVKEKFYEGWNSYDGSYSANIPVKAWMPLPQPYKESEDKE